MAALSHSSWTSDSPGTVLQAGISETDLESLRHRGWRGGWIRNHRAFFYLPLSFRRVVEAALLAIGMTCLWLAEATRIGQAWGAIFSFWVRHLGWPAEVSVIPQEWAGLHFAVPYLNMSAPAPDAAMWWLTAVVCACLFAATTMISDEAAPWKYLCRAVLLIQASALAYFAFAGAQFPHDLASYTVSMLVFGAVLVAMVPLILAFTYYVFDFTLLQKLGLTAITMLHLGIFIPVQYLAHAYLLHFSILFMPVLYFGFGPFLDVLVLISFYSWGMSWRSPLDRLTDEGSAPLPVRK